MADQTSFLSLPVELRMESIGMVPKFEGTVVMMDPDTKPGKYGRWKRKSKSGQEIWHPLSVFVVSKEFHELGLDLFWRVKTFDFTSFTELDMFLRQCHVETRGSIRHLTLFRGFEFERPFVDRRRLLDRQGPWLHWPPSSHLLSLLPFLTCLHFDTECFQKTKADAALLDALHGPASRTNEKHVRLCCVTKMDLSRLYARDILLKSIPDNIFTQLKQLTISFETIPLSIERTWVRLNEVAMVDVMPYTRDLRSGAWSVCPIGTTSTAKTPQAWARHLWAEARAAVHWESRITTTKRPAGWWTPWLVQWGTWVHEWEHWHGEYDAIAGMPQGFARTPRSLEELFEQDDEGELVVREEHSFDTVVERLRSWGHDELWATGRAVDQR